MSRPAQLEQQIERVKQLQAEIAEPTEQQAVVTEPKEPTENVTTEPVAQVPATISKEEYDRLEQKYRTLQGMHNADINRFRDQLTAANNAYYNLEQRLAEVERAAHVPAEPTKYVTAEDEEEYGETLELMRRAAKEEAENIFRNREEAYLARIAQLEDDVDRVNNTVVPTVQDLSRMRIEQAEGNFWASINAQVPNWQTINNDQAFKDWLMSEDPLTGATRQQFLSQAQSELNASRVIKFFKEWERTAAGGPTPAPRKPQEDLQQYVAPGTSRATAPVDQTKKQWTREEISKFYQDSMMGKYNNRPEEKSRIEKDIFAAQAEGRIKQS